MITKFTTTTMTNEVVLFGYLYAIARITVEVTPANGVESVEINGYELYDAEGTPVEVVPEDGYGVTHKGVMASLLMPVAKYVESQTDYYIWRAKGLGL